MSFLSGGSIFQQIRSQKVRALAIASQSRVKIAPELPTVIEAGVPGFAVTQWHALMAPRGTPKAIVERLSAEIHKAVLRPDVASRFAQDGTEAIGSSPRQFGEHLQRERDQWSRVVKASNIRAE